MALRKFNNRTRDSQPPRNIDDGGSLRAAGAPHGGGRCVFAFVGNERLSGWTAAGQPWPQRRRSTAGLRSRRDGDRQARHLRTLPGRADRRRSGAARSLRQDRPAGGARPFSLPRATATGRQWGCFPQARLEIAIVQSMQGPIPIRRGHNHRFSRLRQS
jgi:hypothetical protein